MGRDHKKYRVFMAGFEEFERIPLPQPGVFIAHDFSGRDNKTDRVADAPRKVNDYRLSYTDGFIRDDGTTELVPVYAPVHSGTILQTLCKEMINTDAGIFDVSFGRRYNANVLIELGISLGINHPTIVVAEEAHKPLLEFLEILNPLYYKNENDLAERVGDVVRQRIYDFDSRLSRYYCTICQQKECRCRKSYPQEENRYWLAGSDGDEKVYDDIRRDMKHVARTFNIKPLDASDDHHTTLCNWLYHIRKSRFALFYSQSNGKHHHGAENAETMVQLGMAIGAGIPWRLMLPEVDEAPTDLKGYVDIRILDDHNLTRSNLMGAIGALRDIAIPYWGVEDILPMGEWVEEDEELSIDIDILFSDIPISLMINVPPMPDNVTLDEVELSWGKNLLFANPTEPIVLDGVGGITLATAVCHQPDVREYFDLGICWLNANQDISQITDEITNIIQQILDGEDRKSIGFSELDLLQDEVDYFTTHLKKKSPNSRILLVVDNAQDPQIAQALSALATPQSVVLFTTHNADIFRSQVDTTSQPGLMPNQLKQPFILILARENENDSWSHNVIYAIEKLNYKYNVARGDKIQGYVLDVFKYIQDKLKDPQTIVIADLTDNDPDVFLRLGMAHTYSERVIMSISYRATYIPFDISGKMVHRYDITKLRSYIQSLEEAIKTVHETGKPQPFWGDVLTQYPTKVFFTFKSDSIYSQFYDEAIEPYLKKQGIRASRRGNSDYSTFDIMEKIWAYIHSCDVFCADLSISNANVAYELGIAYVLNKTIIPYRDEYYSKNEWHKNILKEILRHDVLEYDISNLSQQDDFIRKLAEIIKQLP